MKAIAVISKNLAIGRNNDLLFHLPTDLAHYKKETIGNTVIMGENTIKSLPGGKPLPGRTTMILSPTMEGAYRTIDDLVKAAPKDAYVCGGASTYAQLMPYVDELILTEVDCEVKDADTFFPQFREEFQCYEESEPIQDNGYTYQIRRYKRIKNFK